MPRMRREQEFRDLQACDKAVNLGTLKIVLARLHPVA
jgi:hypothetical protein